MTLLPLLLACSTPAVGPQAVFEPAGAFFDTPFPSDARLGPDGGQDWSSFPNPLGMPLLDTFLDRASQRHGAATNAAIWLKLDGPIEGLPQPLDSVRPGSPLQLVDVDPRSPEFGRRVPLR